MNARLDFDQIFRGESDREHPPGYYALIRATSMISDSETGLRLPSAIASSLAAAVAYLLGRRLVNHWVGLLGAAILIVSPLDVWYAQEARQPVFAALAVVTATYLLTRSHWAWRAASAAVLLLGLYIDYITAVGWVAVGAMWLVIWLPREPQRAANWVIVTAAATLAYIPLQGAQFVAGFEGLLGYEGAGIWYGDILNSNPITSNPIGLLVVGGIATAIAFALARRLTADGRMARAVSWMVVIGFAVGSAVSPFPRAYSVKKVIVVGWPILALLIAYLVLHRIGRGRTALISTILVLSVVGTVASYFVPKDDWRQATAVINANAAPGDVAWVGPDHWAADAYLYYDGALPVFYDREPASSLGGVGEVWMITYRRPQDTAPSLEAEAWFDDHWTLVEEVPLYRLALRRYAPR
jgi:mannosyltransferase